MTDGDRPEDDSQVDAGGTETSADSSEDNPAAERRPDGSGRADDRPTERGEDPIDVVETATEKATREKRSPISDFDFDIDHLLSMPQWGRHLDQWVLTALTVALVTVLLAELAMFYGRADYALWLHMLALLFCLVVPLRHEPTVVLLKPFALLPLFRLVNLGMPTFVELTLMTFPVVYLPLLPAIYVVVRAQDGLTIDWNPRALARWTIPAIAVSALLAIGEYLIIAPAALIPELTVGWLLILTLVMIGSVGLVEELLFRGVLQRVFGAHLGQWTGVLLASALFAAMHSIYGSGLEVVFAGVIGLVFGIIYEWTDSMGLITLMHGVLNVFLFGTIPIRGIGLGLI